MLTFFTDPYEDELLYGAISRYHYYIGNIDFKDTLKELFGKNSLIPSLYFPSNLDYLANQLSGKYTSEFLIYNHTAFPYYAPFLPEYRQKEIIKLMKEDGGKSIYSKIGVTAGGICSKEGIFYCPLCAKEEVEEYGEPYIHRLHQLQGVILCPKHKIKLIKYHIDYRTSSRLEYIRLDKDLIDFDAHEEQDTNKDKLILLAKSANFLLKSNNHSISKENISKKYKKLLDSKGLLTISGNVRQKELHESFLGYYDRNMLMELESHIDNDDEFNWLKVMLRNSNTTVHPLRHILFINYLSDINSVFEEKVEVIVPFGKKPWPCLNPVAEHYKKDIVTDINITADYKTRVPVGTFSCRCGFVYSRKGPDIFVEDKYRIGRIKEFGHLWKDTLRAYLIEGNYGLRELGRLMQCDPRTILKFDKELGINFFSGSEVVNSNKKEKNLKQGSVELDSYRRKIINTIKANPFTSRTEIRNLNKKEYMYLYRNDKNWLFEVLPKKKYSMMSRNKLTDWKTRDEEILNLVQYKYKELIKRDNSARVTKSLIGKELGISSLIEKNLEKLPKTKEYLNKINESTQEFQIRRAKLIIDNKLENEEIIKLWQIQKLAGIRSKQFNEIKTELEEYLNNRLLINSNN